MRMGDAEKKAAALPPKLTVPMIVFFLPVLFLVILGPSAIRYWKWADLNLVRAAWPARRLHPLVLRTPSTGSASSPGPCQSRTGACHLRGLTIDAVERAP